MRISHPDSRRRYSKLYAISAGSHFTLRACSQASKGISLQQNWFLSESYFLTSARARAIGGWLRVCSNFFSVPINDVH